MARHQITLESLEGYRHDNILASSTSDKKKLIARSTEKMISFVVEKDGLVQIFTNLPAAVKKYNE